VVRGDLDAHCGRQEATISGLAQQFEQYRLSALSMEESLKELQHKVGAGEEQLGQLVLTLRAEVKGVQHELQTFKKQQEEQVLLDAAAQPQPATAAPNEEHTKLILTLHGEVGGLQQQLSATQSQLASVAAASQPQEDWNNMRESLMQQTEEQGHLVRTLQAEVTRLRTELVSGLREELDTQKEQARREFMHLVTVIEKHEANQEESNATLRANVTALDQQVLAQQIAQQAEAGQVQRVETLANAAASTATSAQTGVNDLRALFDDFRTRREEQILVVQADVENLERQVAARCSGKTDMSTSSSASKMEAELKELYALLEKRQAGQEQQLRSFQAEVGNLQQQLPLQFHSLEEEIRGLRLLSEGEQAEGGRARSAARADASAPLPGPPPPRPPRRAAPART